MALGERSDALGEGDAVRNEPGSERGVERAGDRQRGQQGQNTEEHRLGESSVGGVGQAVVRSGAVSPRHAEADQMQGREGDQCEGDRTEQREVGCVAVRSELVAQVRAEVDVSESLQEVVDGHVEALTR